MGTIIGTPLGWVMWLCYQLTRNYGVALLLFTIITRAAMLPATLKQQKSTAKMTMIQPQMQELQTKYANNREKLAEEMNKLYQRENYNPASGCLPMMIPLVIMFGLIDVIYKPLKHLLHIPAEIITQMSEIANSGVLGDVAVNANTIQLAIIQSVKTTPDIWTSVSAEYIEKIASLRMNFFGINLGLTPSTSMFFDIFKGNGFNPLLLIPILSGLSAMASSIISLRTTASTTANQAGAGSMRTMMLIMPIFSLMITFSVPAGVGLYWFYSNLVAVVQSLVMNKYYNPKEMAEKAKKEFEERQEKERLERIEAKKQAKLRAKESGEVDEQALSQKEINRRKLAEARKRDAEKYGEAYVEVTDEDVI